MSVKVFETNLDPEIWLFSWSNTVNTILQYQSPQLLSDCLQNVEAEQKKSLQQF